MSLRKAAEEADQQLLNCIEALKFHSDMSYSVVQNCVAGSEKVRGMIASALNGSDWISVATPPANGTTVIAYMADRSTVIVCLYVGDFSLVRCGTDGFTDHGVTHWMPLPSPPKVSCEVTFTDNEEAETSVTGVSQ